MKFNELIKSKRKEQGLSLKEVSEKLAYTLQSISLYEKGDIVPNIEILNPMCKLYKLDINSLVYGIDAFNDDFDQNVIFDRVKFVEKLKTLRKNNNLSLQKISEKVNISYRSMVRMESGEKIPTVEEFKAIVAVLHTTPKELYYGIEENRTLINSSNQLQVATY